jgi:hypothetical protein
MGASRTSLMLGRGLMSGMNMGRGSEPQKDKMRWAVTACGWVTKAESGLGRGLDEQKGWGGDSSSSRSSLACSNVVSVFARKQAV